MMDQQEHSRMRKEEDVPELEAPVGLLNEIARPAPDTPRDFVSRAGSPSAVGKTFASIVREMTTDWKEFRSELLRWQSERDRVGAERARRAEEQDRAIADRDDAEDTETHRAQSVADEAYVV
ncbi:hypothetical protein A0H81_09379 [Grifola frondosa]|uniref:Uncharacterized protein n=1 Tax=Grifola frondosa TaxID=5627 RepID=A0A1C7M149_GRIFR|nr:hypothetical protein A0H81_09379 [Grifola frondosa]